MGVASAEIEEELGMSKQAMHKLAHAALSVVWEKLKKPSGSWAPHAGLFSIR
jgi:hypothetical protein